MNALAGKKLEKPGFKSEDETIQVVKICEAERHIQKVGAYLKSGQGNDLQARTSNQNTNPEFTSEGSTSIPAKDPAPPQTAFLGINSSILYGSDKVSFLCSHLSILSSPRTTPTNKLKAQALRTPTIRRRMSERGTV
eukprot:CAMPEP_0174258866 /NCGR_PEP_ID=MMETSP0439-20130205/7786_1 /TAXON_ID=0 /ORGANISM="Stereomyxa ramosa, Strain Chinc5" /LENGTH=136 /DNA_ID=CAMNT_0015342537 /DNA_START=687 /DNA_END=1098 /DNA_ORIENTATION=+